MILQHAPLLGLMLDHVIPCMLHVCMGVCRVMLKRLVAETYNNPEMAAGFLKVMEEKCGVKLAKEVKKNGGTRTFADRVNDSRFGRPDLIHIVGKYEELMEVFTKHSRRTATEKKQVSIQY